MSEKVPAAMRKSVRERARRRCEYCWFHEKHAGFPFAVDHVVACKHGGETDLSNLAWTCFACNAFKGSDIASIDIETGRLVRLFNPRKDQWSRHFRLQEAQI